MPLISVDDCFLKGYYQGYLLAAVGIDANDCIYPMAMATVEAETCDSWCWFLPLSGLMSDKQKNDESFQGKALKVALWKAARATTVIDYEKTMAEMEGVSIYAYN
ncbi:hypothetical protein V6N13_024910 [Hibiscus sabdariffa]